MSNVLEKLNTIKGLYVGANLTSIKVDDIINELERNRITDDVLQEVKNAIVSLECVIEWVKNGCTRGPEAEEVRFVVERLKRIFPDADKFVAKFS